MMLTKIKYDPALTAEENLQSWVIPINALVDAISTGIVWENKVAAGRAVDQVYDDLPLPVVAAMVQEKADKLKQQYGL